MRRELSMLHGVSAACNLSVIVGGVALVILLQRSLSAPFILRPLWHPLGGPFGLHAQGQCSLALFIKQ
ncbi:hypothetical protein GHYDROH2_22500 [Geobacter hydrogenophilus]|uniref:Uncharacterized protein n=1 Tax=Geobacter hydrogenophilus TaxID=40983 RepID=A0A9W6G0V0_9BACT|nr:hypothetical protein GHYDROH2_22500 [Geobacter hydrogenophilus]